MCLKTLNIIILNWYTDIIVFNIKWMQVQTKFIGVTLYNSLYNARERKYSKIRTVSTKLKT